jgi:hypothetical protein
MDFFSVLEKNLRAPSVSASGVYKNTTAFQIPSYAPHASPRILMTNTAVA